jgi:hypothetical protein
MLQPPVHRQSYWCLPPDFTSYAYQPKIQVQWQEVPDAKNKFDHQIQKRMPLLHLLVQVNLKTLLLLKQNQHFNQMLSQVQQVKPNRKALTLQSRLPILQKRRRLLFWNVRLT